MNPDRIIAVKLADFGDALLTTPALRALRETYPGARLDVLTTPLAAEVYHRCGLADEVLAFEKGRYDSVSGLLSQPLAPVGLGRRLRDRRYDMLVLFHHLTTRYGAMKHGALAMSSGARVRVGLARPGSRRAWFLTHRAMDPGFGQVHEAAVALLIAEAAGATAADKSLAFDPGPEATEQASVLMAGLGSAVTSKARRGARPIVAIHPGSGPYSPARRWPPERFALVAEALALQGAEIVLVGRNADDTAVVRDACDAISLDLSDRTSLPALAAVLARCDLLVCNDSGVMHLATAVGTPVVAVFGPTSPDAWGPWWPSDGRIDGPPDRTAAPPGRPGKPIAEPHGGRAEPAATGNSSPPSPTATPHRAVAVDLPCRPCLYSGYALGSPLGCPTRDCVSWLGPQSVIDAALESLSKPRL